MTHLLQRDLVTLAGIWAVAVVIPGPNFLLIVHTAATEGRSAALAVGLGCSLGTWAWITGSLFGLSLLFTDSPAIASAARLVGAGYLIVTGVMMCFSRQRGHSEQHKVIRSRRVAPFGSGLFTTLANPKTVAFATSIFATAVPRHAPQSFLILVVIIIVGMSLFWYITLALLGSSSAFASAYGHVGGSLRRIAGLAFMLFGVKLMLFR